MSLLLPLLLSSAFALQPPGTFHEGEAVARDGERWLALRVSGDQASLSAVQLRVRTVEDPIADEPGERTGQEVSADGGEPLLFLRGDGFTSGAVETASVTPREREWPAPLQHQVRFRDASYRITTECSSTPRGAKAEQLQFDCRVVLRAGAVMQTLLVLTGYYEHGATTLSTPDDSNAWVLFAGDLDRDGKLDLIFDASDHYNLSRPTLFLSSQARRGEVLHQVARYESVGC